MTHRKIFPTLKDIHPAKAFPVMLAACFSQRAAFAGWISNRCLLTERNLIIMQPISLVLLITLCYAGYNLLVKVSGSNTDVAASPIVATICLQVAALGVSLIYLFFLLRQQTLISLSPKACLWAAVAGVSIGLAEVLYFYLFRGFAGEKPVDAAFAIPLIVGGTILIAVIASRLLFAESINSGQWLGLWLTFAGLLVLGVNGR